MPFITPRERVKQNNQRINKSEGRNNIKRSNLNMSGDGSLVYWYQKTSHSSYNHLRTMEFMMTKVLDCLRVTEDVDIGLLIPVTIPLEIVDFIAVTTKVVMMVEVDIGHKIPSNLTLTIV